jgi:adenylyltransferase/sulfurtransferase
MHTHPYHRQIILQGWSPEIQERIQQANVMIIGAGALGSHAGMALCAAGVENFILFDGDTLAEHNLHRQFHYTQSDCGKNKAEILFEKMKALNPFVKASVYPKFWDRKIQLNSLPDIIIDGSDVFTTKYEIHAYANQHILPWIYASVLGYRGEIAVFMPGSACYRCLYSDPPANAESCDVTGVVPMLPAWVAQKQAWEALKVLGAPGSIMHDQLWQIRLDQGGERTLIIDKSPNCSREFIQKNTPFSISEIPEIDKIQMTIQIRNQNKNWFFFDIRPEASYGNIADGLEYLDPSTGIDLIQKLPAGAHIVLACAKGKNSKQLAMHYLQKLPNFHFYTLKDGLQTDSVVI